MRRTFLVLALLTLAVAVGGLAWRAIAPGAGGGRAGERGPAPVEIASIEHGPIELRRTFSATLEARAEFIVAPKVGGRVVEMAVDLADDVERDQVVARIDDAEHVQEVVRAEADLAVARANLTEARSNAEIATRALARVEQLRERKIASESQLDDARAARLSSDAAVEVARAQVARAEAALETARIQLGDTRVRASWSGGDGKRVVAERFVDEGVTVSANAPLLSIVELDPLVAVLYATEQDYPRLRPGQEAELRTDAYPDRVFPAVVERVSPVFRRESRQARIELRVPNAERPLKPGMYARVEVRIDRVDDATIVPADALVTRDGASGVFVLDPGGETVSLRPVTVGLRDGVRVQVSGAGLEGAVVTLGQQMLEDGSRVRTPAAEGG